MSTPTFVIQGFVKNTVYFGLSPWAPIRAMGPSPIGPTLPADRRPAPAAHDGVRRRPDGGGPAISESALKLRKIEYVPPSPLSPGGADGQAPLSTKRIYPIETKSSPQFRDVLFKCCLTGSVFSICSDYG